MIEGLRAYFDRLDAGRSGSLSLADFKAVEVHRLGITLPDVDFVKAELFEPLDTDKDSRVSWADFRTGLLERSADLCFDSRVSLYRALFGEGAHAGARSAAELLASLEANKVRTPGHAARRRVGARARAHQRARARARSPAACAPQRILESLFGDDLPALLNVFKALDKNGSGSVSWDEFVERIEGTFRPRAPIAHRERLKRRAPPPYVAPPSAPPVPSI
mgnify:CR=1 FL=1